MTSMRRACFYLPYEYARETGDKRDEQLRHRESPVSSCFGFPRYCNTHIETFLLRGCLVHVQYRQSTFCAACTSLPPCAVLKCSLRVVMLLIRNMASVWQLLCSNQAILKRPVDGVSMSTDVTLLLNTRCACVLRCVIVILDSLRICWMHLYVLYVSAVISCKSLALSRERSVSSWRHNVCGSGPR